MATVTALAEREIGFASITEAIDTTTSGGKLVFHIFGALAEFERELVRERTKAGLEAARARGRLGGRRPSLSKDQAALARRLYDEGQLTVQQIADQLRVARSTIYRYLNAS